MVCSLTYSEHQKGIFIAACGVFILSFDAMLIRLAGASAWDIAFWRGWLMCATFTTLSLLARKQTVLPPNARSWQLALAVALLYGINTLLFVYSISHTSTANTVIILASSPLFSALFSSLFLKEKLKTSTLITMLITFCGVIYIFAGSLDSLHWKGDLAALTLAISTGAVLTLLRRAHHFSILPVIALSGAVAGLLSSSQANPLSLPPQSYIWLGIMGIFQIPVATWLLMRAPRYLPSAEVSLFLLIETILGPIWVWFAVNEQIPERTFLGGAIILSAIALNSVLTMRQRTKPES